MLTSFLAVCLGAALGAVVRWGLSVGLNHLWPALPPGTLVANLAGGFLVGLALSFFARDPALDAAWKLFVVTGFLGGLTTFSSFSAEVVLSLQQGRTGWAMATIAAHLIGSLTATWAGLMTPALWKGTGT